MTTSRFAMGAAIASIMVAVTAPAGATTLREALARAYASNPTLLAQRERSGSTADQVRIERAAGRPSARLDADVVQDVHGAQRLYGYDRADTADVHLSAPLYQGGRVRNAVRGAEQRAEAAAQDVRTTENRVLADVATAYVDVIEMRRVVALDGRYVGALEDNLLGVHKGFDAGDLTQTDIDQSQARLNAGRAQTLRDRAALVTAESSYARLVGEAPGELETPPPLDGLPATAGAAEDAAAADNPEIASAARNAKGAGLDVRVAGAARLPTVTASIDGGYYRYDGGPGSGLLTSYDDYRGDAAQARVSIRLPLYQGGQVSAQIDQARHNRDAATRDADAVSRRVAADVRSAWSEHQAAVAAMDESRSALTASVDAARGMQIERGLGQRHVNDVLAADQDRLVAEKAVAQAEHDAYATGVELLVGMGRYDAAHLGIR